MEPDRKGLVFMGTDVTKIPCFRDSWLTGISGSIGSGLLFFLFTSNAHRAYQVAAGSFSVITLGKWFICRRQYEKGLQQQAIFKAALEAKILLEGTEMEKAMEKAMYNTQDRTDIEPTLRLEDFKDV